MSLQRRLLEQSPKAVIQNVEVAKAAEVVFELEAAPEGVVGRRQEALARVSPQLVKQRSKRQAVEAAEAAMDLERPNGAGGKEVMAFVGLV